jgi:hypothetical protein
MARGLQLARLDLAALDEDSLPPGGYGNGRDASPSSMRHTFSSRTRSRSIGGEGRYSRGWARTVGTNESRALKRR